MKLLKCLTCGQEQFVGDCVFTHFADCDQPLMAVDGVVVLLDDLKCADGDRVVHERDGVTP